MVVTDIFNPKRFSSSRSDIRKKQEKYAAKFQGCKRVLDFGPGEGLFLELLRELRVEGLGVDMDSQAVAKAHEKGLQVVEADGLVWISEQEEAFDGIFCSNVLEHLPPEKAAELLTQFVRLLSPGGLLILVVPNPRSVQMLSETFWLDPTHVRFYPLRMLQSGVTHLGLVVEESGDDPDTRVHPRSLWQWVKFFVRSCTLPRALRGGDEVFVCARAPRVSQAE
ncbi:class I SAM-dependent methyltransferase [Pseudodesulfovibrio methanolicus]|uniref:Class I SAM-dependent methyltransferase n=1 Tax=Pseudodesulfovibrio methanolicus TaxID=3126690 RepID=A0ABZ2ITM9_9BACT